MVRRPARVPISRVRLAILYSEQGGCCAGCFKPLGEDVHVDHVVPLAGAGWTSSKPQPLHSACSQVKGTLGAAEWFARNWQAFLRTQKRPTRQWVRVAPEHELVERLAAYWSKRSVTALFEEGAAYSLQAIEERGGAMQAPDERVRGRWARSESALAARLPSTLPKVNGDLFAK